MRRAAAIAGCLCLAVPALADPDPPPHPVDPLSPPTASKGFAPPAVNPALPVVTLATMPVPIYARDPDTEPRTAAWIATGVVAAFAIAMEAWWLYRDKYESRGQTLFDDPKCHVVTGEYDPGCYIATLQQQAIHNHQSHIWNSVELGLGAGMGLSGFVAAYLWSRHYHPLHRVGFVPAANGGSVSIGGDF
jgi:hypothetical protein